MSSYVYGKSTTQRPKYPVIVTKSKYILPTQKQFTTSSPRRNGHKLTNTLNNKSPTSKTTTTSVSIIDSLSKSMLKEVLVSNDNSPASLKRTSSNGTPTNGANNTTINRNGHHRGGGITATHPAYPYHTHNKTYTRTKNIHRNNSSEDEIHRVYLEDNSLNSSLLSSSTPNNEHKKITTSGSSGTERSASGADTDCSVDKLTSGKNMSITICDGDGNTKLVLPSANGHHHPHHHHHQHHQHSKKSHKNSSSHHPHSNSYAAHEKSLKKKMKKKEAESKRKKRTGKQWQTFIMRRTLLIINIITLLIGVTTLVLAGIIDPQPLHRIGTTGAQVSLASIFVIFVSLVGLYGSRLRNHQLLFVYAYCLIAELIIRSVIALIYVFFYHNVSRLFVSMISVIPEVALTFLALAVALDLKQDQKLQSFASHIKTVPV
ncbi:uncharacterized protein LOC141857081 [Brevipalpus obovatus]|uniref:uncharacterized protein LOC141857081 n=1 Tax=Brevipalpus obovatus TaxID=246614 RepID=UPI003D9E6CAD